MIGSNYCYYVSPRPVWFALFPVDSWCRGCLAVSLLYKLDGIITGDEERVHGGRCFFEVVILTAVKIGLLVEWLSVSLYMDVATRST